jgi:hypothetical protein
MIWGRALYCSVRLKPFSLEMLCGIRNLNLIRPSEGIEVNDGIPILNGSSTLNGFGSESLKI